MLASAFAVAWEWENTELISELVEYHSARGTFNAEQAATTESENGRRPPRRPPFIDAGEELLPALAAAGPPSSGGEFADPPGPVAAVADATRRCPPIMSHYRALALQRYGRDVTAAEPAWSTWP